MFFCVSVVTSANKVWHAYLSGIASTVVVTVMVTVIGRSKRRGKQKTSQNPARSC
ncbi:hypothetical protein [Faecalicatena contorta]|uniref:hypothetical protein n=1 Tax=Faecalicatena contorta TaxID=39482 RepID=UPI001F2E759A|nr:hypothetical protein [Faecalicatena contorta]MCF2554830.1 hypothetical protein [Faecalicatena contorta]